MSLASTPAKVSITTSIAHHPFFSMAFRSSFLLGTLVSMFALIKWLGLLNGWWTMSNPGLSPVVWHFHEMLFGFSATIAVGFILTAVQTWTGLPSIKQLPLFLLVAIWGCARVLFWLNDANSIYLGLLLQMTWWITVISVYTNLVFKAENKRNYQFVAVFTVMAMFNFAMVYADFNGHTGLAHHLGRAMILVFGILVSIVGGRVIPFFTQRGANLSAIKQPPWLNATLLAVSLTGASIFVLGYVFALPFTPAALMVTAGTLHLYRLTFWKPLTTKRIPLLWSLHLSYLLLGVGLVLLGTSYWVPVITFSSALHLITIGAMAAMIFAMMSRVSLGHTGRALVVHRIMPIAFLLMTLAAFTRVVLPVFNLASFGWGLSVALWLLAAVLFLWVYTPILIAPRIDGHLH